MADTVVKLSNPAPVLGPSISDVADPHRASHELSLLAPYRLVIEEREGVFVYIVRDLVTGEVLRQTPREEVLRLKSDPATSPGAVFDGRI